VKSRRFVITTALATVGVLALAGCASGGSASPSTSKQSLTVFISGGANIQDLWQKSLIPAFVKANPGYTIKVILDLHGEHDTQTIAQLTSAAQAKKDPGYDLVDAGFITQLSKAGLLTPVSVKNIPKLANVPANTAGSGRHERHSVSRFLGAACLQLRRGEDTAEDAGRPARLDQVAPGKVHLQHAEHGWFGAGVRDDGS